MLPPLPRFFQYSRVFSVNEKNFGIRDVFLTAFMNIFCYACDVSFALDLHSSATGRCRMERSADVSLDRHGDASQATGGGESEGLSYLISDFEKKSCSPTLDGSTPIDVL